MRQQILTEIINALNLRVDYFLREEDVKLYLANHFILTSLFDNVFIEYHIPNNLLPAYPWADINNVYIDIVLEKDGQFYPIEIKYKTVAQVLPYFVFGQAQPVTLGQHGAQNIGCYDFWKDVKRTEIFSSTFPLQVSRGIVLFISNDLSYQNAPLNQGVGYAQFSIHQGRGVIAGTFLNWNGNLAIANGRPGFVLNHNYSLNWTAMNILQHYYILT